VEVCKHEQLAVDGAADAPHTSHMSPADDAVDQQFGQAEIDRRSAGTDASFCYCHS
jgi:hypothetical protein